MFTLSILFLTCILPIGFNAKTAGLNTIYVYSGSNAADVPGMTASNTTGADGETATYPIAKDLRIAAAAPGQYARINLASMTAGTVQNAVVTIKKVR